MVALLVRYLLWYWELGAAVVAPLVWYLLWYLSVLVGRVVVSLGAGGWWEQ